MTVRDSFDRVRSFVAWHWPTMIALAVTAPVFWCTIGVNEIGTPYLRRGPKYCKVDRTSAIVRCTPPVWCDYVGIAGTRGLWFWDADNCPLVTMLPPVSEQMRGPPRDRKDPPPPPGWPPIRMSLQKTTGD